MDVTTAARSPLLRSAVFGLLALLSACGGGDDAPDARETTARVLISAEAPGARCRAGGFRIDAGPDANANGTLDPNEVTTTGHVCNGRNGANGTNGTDGSSGVDGEDGTDGTNGSDGEDGTDGSDGLSTLLSIVAEPAGAHCTNGGSAVHAGVDDNANGVLDAGEVDSTSYICAGEPGSGLVWSVVTGTTQQAAVNNGYIAANDQARVTITLPASAAAGDIVRIAGAGAGGWRVAQNAGQTINGGPLGVEAGVTWTARGAVLDWSSVASSANGHRLAAAEWFGSLWISTDRGLTWTERLTDANRLWAAIASSADGQRLVAVAYAGHIHTSSDGGATWSAHMTDTQRWWYAVASSADGMRLVAAESDGTLHVSTDGGQTWTARATDVARSWLAVASSADGQRMAAVESTGYVYTSTDGGVTWIQRGASRDWGGIASSADGLRLVAVGYEDAIYTSTDGGITWTARDSARAWLSVASSADGQRLVAVVRGGRIYTSTNAGVTWTPRESDREWLSTAISAAGDSLLAVTAHGPIYSSTSWTTIGTAGAISGGAHDSIELQSLGDGRFTVIGHEGQPTVE